MIELIRLFPPPHNSLRGAFDSQYEPIEPIFRTFVTNDTISGTVLLISNFVPPSWRFLTILRCPLHSQLCILDFPSLWSNLSLYYYVTTTYNHGLNAGYMCLVWLLSCLELPCAALWFGNRLALRRLLLIGRRKVSGIRLGDRLVGVGYKCLVSCSTRLGDERWKTGGEKFNNSNFKEYLTRQYVICYEERDSQECQLLRRFRVSRGFWTGKPSRMKFLVRLQKFQDSQKLKLVLVTVVRVNKVWDDLVLS